MNKSFTRGQWKADGVLVKLANDAWTIIVCPFTEGRDGNVLSREEQKANARLIAASPDLLLALYEMYSMFYAHEQYDDDSAAVVKLARDAINLATGQEA